MHMTKHDISEIKIIAEIKKKIEIKVKGKK